MIIDDLPKQPLEEVPFSVSARTAMQLGRESISSSIVAILELVKNSYDADAEGVHIYFTNDSKTGIPLLVIDDNGHGMSKDQLRNSWMLIGVNDKLLERRSLKKRRVRIGEKGLGRLGLDRLCEKTRIQSFISTKDEGYELVIAWGKYENNYGRLEEVKHQIFSVPSKKVADPLGNQEKFIEHGTRLVLEGLKDDWLKGYKPNDETDDSLLRKLQSELSLLVSPFSSINDFSIWLHFNGRNINVKPDEILQVAEWKLESKLIKQVQEDDPENITWFVQHKLFDSNKLYSEYLNYWEKIIIDQEPHNPECGELEFIMYFIPRQEKLGFTLNQVRDFMNTNQGIRIYRDQFRVKPYGDPSGQHDWLNLALNRVSHPTSRGQTGWRVAYNQVVGAMFIERERNDKLLDQTNREGLVESSAFDDMKFFTRHALEWFEREDVKFFKGKHPIERITKAKEQAEVSAEEAEDAITQFEVELANILEDIEAEVSEESPTEIRHARERITSSYNNLVRSSVNRFRYAQDEMQQAYEEKTTALESEKDTLSNLASLGILVVSFGHETKHYTNLVLTNSAFLLDDIPQLLPSKSKELDQRIQTSLEDLVYGAERIDTFAEFTLKNVRRDKRKRVNVYLHKVINRVMGDFEMLIEEKMNIDVILELEKVAPIRAFLIDWESILVNFMTNAIWALNAVPKGQKKIRVKLYRQDNTLHLLFADSGRGIAVDALDRIFEPTFTTKKNKEGEKWGTGMGLAIVENFVKSYSGSIHAKSRSDLGGAEFHIMIPITQSQ